MAFRTVALGPGNKIPIAKIPTLTTAYISDFASAVTTAVGAAAYTKAEIGSITTDYVASIQAILDAP